MEMTTIAISVKNKQRLASKGKKGKSYDEILEELLK